MVDAVVEEHVDSARNRVRLVDVVDLHLDAGHAVAVLVEGLGFVEVGVDELRVVLVEARLEDGDDAELLGDGRPRARSEGHADLRRRDLHAVAQADIELLGQRPADDDARHLGDLFGALARVGIDRVREAVVVGELALVAAGRRDIARRTQAGRGLDAAAGGGSGTLATAGLGSGAGVSPAFPRLPRGA